MDDELETMRTRLAYAEIDLAAALAANKNLRHERDDARRTQRVFAVALRKIQGFTCTGYADPDKDAMKAIATSVLTTQEELRHE